MSNSINERIAKVKGLRIVSKYPSGSLHVKKAGDFGCERNWDNDIADAWPLLEEMRRVAHGNLRAWLDFVDAVAYSESGVGTVLTTLTPRAICIAWLAVNEAKG